MSRAKFRKILIANRSEIAVRIARTARALGYRTVAVFSDADAGSPHLDCCDEAVHIGPTSPAESYLNIHRLLHAARCTGADAVHPGYGFLAENAGFAAACIDAGLVFIGPSPQAVAAMGDKSRAKTLMQAAGVPCIPGWDCGDQDDAVLLAAAHELGFPVMIKALAGGGGRGIRRVERPDDFAHALRTARSEATTAFGDARVMLEKAIAAPRHVEVQVFADRHGGVIHLGERDCSVQRRHQKLIEEAPCPAVDAALREAMGAAAVRAVTVIDYEGAGTVEFLLDRDGNFYFMEMNTRLQVEHTVTEEITGLDLVELQLRIAAGEPLPICQEEVSFRGHAIQARLCSEDPHAQFLPQGGRVHLWQPPAGVRVEHALASGGVIPGDYDSMIAKVIAHGRTREDARRRLCAALEDVVVLGPTTNQCFLVNCLRHATFGAGEVTTDFIDRSLGDLLSLDDTPLRRARSIAAVLLHLAAKRRHADPAATAGLLSRHPATWRYDVDGIEATAQVNEVVPGVCIVVTDGVTETAQVQRVDGPRMRLRMDDRCFEVVHIAADDELLFLLEGAVYRVRDRSHEPVVRDTTVHDGRVRASMGGRVVAVHVQEGQRVSIGQPVVTIEAMKMEHTHVAPVDGLLRTLLVKPDQQVERRHLLAEVERVPAADPVATP